MLATKNKCWLSKMLAAAQPQIARYLRKKGFLVAEASPQPSKCKATGAERSNDNKVHIGHKQKQQWLLPVRMVLRRKRREKKKRKNAVGYESVGYVLRRFWQRYQQNCDQEPKSPHDLNSECTSIKQTVKTQESEQPENDEWIQIVETNIIRSEKRW